MQVSLELDFVVGLCDFYHLLFKRLGGLVYIPHFFVPFELDLFGEPDSHIDHNFVALLNDRLNQIIGSLVRSVKICLGRDELGFVAREFLALFLALLETVEFVSVVVEKDTHFLALLGKRRQLLHVVVDRVHRALHAGANACVPLAHLLIDLEVLLDLEH